MTRLEALIQQAVGVSMFNRILREADSFGEEAAKELFKDPIAKAKILTLFNAAIDKALKDMEKEYDTSEDEPNAS